MKPTATLQRLVRKLKLTTKQASKDYYKGTRSGAMGTHTKHGGYIINYDKVRTYIVPKDLDKFKLTPFVTQKVRPMRGQYGGAANSPISGSAYLRRWKHENGED